MAIMTTINQCHMKDHNGNNIWREALKTIETILSQPVTSKSTSDTLPKKHSKSSTKKGNENNLHSKKNKGKSNKKKKKKSSGTETKGNAKVPGNNSSRATKAKKSDTKSINSIKSPATSATTKVVIKKSNEIYHNSNDIWRIGFEQIEGILNAVPNTSAPMTPSSSSSRSSKPSTLIKIKQDSTRPIVPITPVINPKQPSPSVTSSLSSLRDLNKNSSLTKKTFKIYLTSYQTERYEQMKVSVIRPPPPELPTIDEGCEEKVNEEEVNEAASIRQKNESLSRSLNHASLPIIFANVKRRQYYQQRSRRGQHRGSPVQSDSQYLYVAGWAKNRPSLISHFFPNFTSWPINGPSCELNRSISKWRDTWKFQ